jgi:hypothetical protein
MTGIVAPLETHDANRVIGQPVNDFSLTLVTPLSANHNNVTTGLTG